MLFSRYAAAPLGVAASLITSAVIANLMHVVDRARTSPACTPRPFGA